MCVNVHLRKADYDETGLRSEFELFCLLLMKVRSEFRDVCAGGLRELVWRFGLS